VHHTDQTNGITFHHEDRVARFTQERLAVEIESKYGVQLFYKKLLFCAGRLICEFGLR
jgi:hypothetical protein